MNADVVPTAMSLDCLSKNWWTAAYPGVDVCDVQAFVERETGKVDVELLQPSWLIFSDGFNASKRTDITKRVFDVIVASALLLIVWPIMLVTALALR